MTFAATASHSVDSRDHALDGLRGIAILGVVAIHYLRLEPSNTAWTLVNAVCRSGWLGVDLFFVLSGFLITRILLRTRSRPDYFREFFRRRILRIFPAYYFYLAFCLSVLSLLHSDFANPIDLGWLAAFAFYVPNLAMVEAGAWSPRPELDHMWSLAVEEQFYLIWPLLIWACPPRWVGVACALTIAGAWAFKLWLVHTDAWMYTAYIHPLARADALAAGGLLAYLHMRNVRRPWERWLWVAPAAATAILLWSFITHTGIRLSSLNAIAIHTAAAAIAFAGVIALALRSNSLLSRGLAHPALRFFGKYSYGLYLLHRIWGFLLLPFLLGLINPYVPGNWGLLLAAGLTLCAAVASALLMYRWIELSFLRMKSNGAAARNERGA